MPGVCRTRRSIPWETPAPPSSLPAPARIPGAVGVLTDEAPLKMRAEAERLKAAGVDPQKAVAIVKGQAGGELGGGCSACVRPAAPRPALLPRAPEWRLHWHNLAAFVPQPDTSASSPCCCCWRAPAPLPLLLAPPYVQARPGWRWTATRRRGRASPPRRWVSLRRPLPAPPLPALAVAPAACLPRTAVGRRRRPGPPLQCAPLQRGLPPRLPRAPVWRLATSPPQPDHAPPPSLPPLPARIPGSACVLMDKRMQAEAEELEAAGMSRQKATATVRGRADGEWGGRGSRVAVQGVRLEVLLCAGGAQGLPLPRSSRASLLPPARHLPPACSCRAGQEGPGGAPLPV